MRQFPTTFFDWFCSSSSSSLHRQRNFSVILSLSSAASQISPNSQLNSSKCTCSFSWPPRCLFIHHKHENHSRYPKNPRITWFSFTKSFGLFLLPDSSPRGFELSKLSKPSRYWNRTRYTQYTTPYLLSHHIFSQIISSQSTEPECNHLPVL